MPGIGLVHLVGDPDFDQSGLPVSKFHCHFFNIYPGFVLQQRKFYSVLNFSFQRFIHLPEKELLQAGAKLRFEGTLTAVRQ